MSAITDNLRLCVEAVQKRCGADLLVTTTQSRKIGRVMSVMSLCFGDKYWSRRDSAITQEAGDRRQKHVLTF